VKGNREEGNGKAEKKEEGGERGNVKPLPSKNSVYGLANNQ